MDQEADYPVFDADRIVDSGSVTEGTLSEHTDEILDAATRKKRGVVVSRGGEVIAQLIPMTFEELADQARQDPELQQRLATLDETVRQGRYTVPNPTDTL